jgi:hypothetical protein
MQYIVKKTTELTEQEQLEIVSLFNNVFNKYRTLEDWRNQFLNNALGYSYHALMIEAGIIVGGFSYIPSYYIISNRKYLFATSADLMISKQYRGIIHFYSMVSVIHEYIKRDGIIFVYAFPNDTSYPILTKSELMQDIGNLTTYCLPYRIGGIKPTLKLCNWLSSIFVNMYVFLTSLFASKIVHRFPIEKEAATYNATRYKRLDGKYNVANYKGSEFVYKLMEYEGIRSAFLIDLFEKSATNFNKAVRYIIKNHQHEFDILLYVGYLPFHFYGLIQVPKKLAPKSFHFTGEILRKGEIDNNLVFDISNWDVNLSNYDLL